MRFSLTKEYKEFFYRNKHIEFEDVLSLEQVASLQAGLHDALSKRDPKIYKKGTPLAGRDLFRSSSEVQKIAFSKKFPQVAYDLTSKTPLRLAFDLHLTPKVIGNHYFGKVADFKQGSCLSEIYCLLFFRLGGSPIATPEGAAFIPSPQKVGNLVIVHPELPIDLETLLQDKDQEFYVIAYGSDRLCYTLNELDPITHLIKRFGYVFGDLMKEDTHPLIFR